MPAIRLSALDDEVAEAARVLGSGDVLAVGLGRARRGRYQGRGARCSRVGGDELIRVRGPRVGAARSRAASGHPRVVYQHPPRCPEYHRPDSTGGQVSDDEQGTDPADPEQRLHARGAGRAAGVRRGADRADARARRQLLRSIPAVLPGNVENFVGVAQVPIGLAGPLLVDGEHAKGEFYVPLATAEGTLVASYNRGMKLLRQVGGVKTTVIDDAMQRAPWFLFAERPRGHSLRRVAERALRRGQGRR